MIAQLTQVTKIFGLDSSRPQQVLVGVDLSIAEGETIAIVGSSGSGKSTLLNLLGTLDQPTTGEVTLFGESIKGLGEKELAAIRAEKIGFIFQMHHLLPQLTALENVLLPTLVDSDSARKNSATERAKSLLEKVGLAEHMDKRPAQLSGGERQRVAVVRALINEPQLLLADEPTGALDETNAKSLIELLAQINNDTGVAIVLVTHDLSLAKTMNRVGRIHAGKLTWE